jgi:Copper type II ascorbate-dependent monooxygenase, C-terminal domain
MKKTLIFSILIAFLGTSCEKAFEYNVADIPKDFTPLAKPAAGKGYQMHVPPFPVPANYEREWYMRMPIGNKEKIYVTSMEVKMRDGSHHMIAYPFRDENDPKNPQIGVMRDQNLPSGSLNFRSNLNMNGFVLESTAPEYRIDIPGGYAIPFEGGATLDLNAHYFNKTTKTLFGEVYMNLNTKPKSEIKGELQYLYDDNHEKITLPPNTKTVITDTLICDTLTQIMVLTSHNHKRGERFEIYGVGGEHNGKLLYTGTDYIHPPILYFEKPLIFKKGEGLRYVVTYNNTTNRTISFGVTSEDEMGILYGYFIK